MYFVLTRTSSSPQSLRTDLSAENCSSVKVSAVPCMLACSPFPGFQIQALFLHLRACVRPSSLGCIYFCPHLELASPRVGLSAKCVSSLWPLFLASSFLLGDVWPRIELSRFWPQAPTFFSPNTTRPLITASDSKVFKEKNLHRVTEQFSLH